MVGNHTAWHQQTELLPLFQQDHSDHIHLTTRLPSHHGDSSLESLKTSRPLQDSERTTPQHDFKDRKRRTRKDYVQSLASQEDHDSGRDNVYSITNR